MPYPVPPPLPPVIHHVSQNSPPAVESSAASDVSPNGIAPVSAAELQTGVSARSLGGGIAINSTAPDSSESRLTESRSNQSASNQSEPAISESLPVATPRAGILPVAELDALIAVTKARATAPQSESSPQVGDFARSGQPSGQVSSQGLAAASSSESSSSSSIESSESSGSSEFSSASDQSSGFSGSSAADESSNNDLSLPEPPAANGSVADRNVPNQTAPTGIVPDGSGSNGTVPDGSAPETLNSGQVLTIPGQPETPPNSSTPGSQPAAPASPGSAPTAQTPPEVIELSADRQEYDEQRQVFRAEGNVVMRFRQAILTGDRIQVNIPNRLAVADGNAALQRGQQTLRGQQFTYNFGFDQGSVLQARGEVALGASSDFDVNQPPTIGSPLSPLQSVGAQVSAAQPLQVSGGTGGLTFGVGTGGQNAPAQQGPGLSRLRFEAEQLQFNGQNWEATNVRISNDPFSPPELELRSNRVTLTPLSPTSTEIRARNPRAVFDQGLTLPLLINRAVISQERQNPGLFNIGFDQKDRGGLFIERTFNILSNPIVDFSLTPQILVQRAITDEGFGSAASYGLIARLTANPTPTTSIVGNAVFTSLDLRDLDDRLRASLRVQQRIVANHTLALEYSYRDRLFNGSLGFQNVQSSLGFVITSPPNFTLGQTGITLNYQGGIQFINARTDRDSLLLQQNGFIAANDDNRRIDLTRYQASATLSRPVLLWAGTPLPPTPTEGLRYTPNPVVPYIALVPTVRGVYSAYSSGDTQASLTGSITLAGQFGHFSRPFLDYTAFNVSYSRTALSGESPFLFDRVADEQVLSAGITQQIYGPVRFGVQVAYNLDTGNNIDTIYTLEYSRRSYSITAAYSPEREAASLVFRLFNFNWTGDPGPFSGLNPRDNVIDGVRQETAQ